MAARRSPHPDSAPFLSRADRTEEDEEEDEGPEEEQDEGDSRPTPLSEAETAAVTGVSGHRARLMVAVLCYVNLLNYMDRFTVAGVLPEIEAYFGIGDGSSGLLQTVFISSYMVLAPLFGFLGDRSSRRLLLCVGIALWSTVTLASSFVPRQHFWLLLLTRGLVGVGEASYSTVAPTIIADLFVGDRRSRMLGLFYFAIPVGSGLGYIAGSKVKDVMHDWHWALRVTPALGVVAVVLLLLVMKEPPRGAVERHGPPSPLHYTSWCDDVQALARNRSFVLSSLGFTAVAFVTGALALWAPAFLQRARLAAGAPPADDSLVFGAVTCVTGVLGVGAGVELSRRLRLRSSRADPLVCAIGLLGAAPCLFLAVALARASIPVTYVFIFIGETLLSLNWALVADILLYVVVPTRRSTAEALQIVMSHLLGDAGSPYLVGVMSDAVRRHRPPTPLWAFRSLGYALTLCAFVGALGGGFFLATALVLPADRRRAHLQAQGLLAEAGGNPGAVSERIVVPQGGRAAQLPVSSVLI